MAQEEKELLLKDLCARLPYGVKVMKQFKSQTRTLMSIDVVNLRVYFLENDVNSPFGFDIENQLHFSQQIKPYLRPMSSMTEEEKEEFHRLKQFSVTVVMPNGVSLLKPTYIVDLEEDGEGLNHLYDWLNSHHFDYRGLIEKGLALEAPEGMYNIKEK